MRAHPASPARRAGCLAVCLALAAVVGGCSGSSVATPSVAASGVPSPSLGSPAASTSIPTSPVTGVVTKVDSAGLDKVSGFTLRTNAGQVLEIAIGTLENGAQFPPGHLAEHLATAAPVRVWFREQGGKLVAYRIEDAG